MRKVLLFVLAIVLLAPLVVFAQGYSRGQIPVVVTNSQGTELDVSTTGGVTIAPDVAASYNLSVSVSDNDSFTYGSGDTGRYVDLSAYNKARVEFDISGTTPSFTVNVLRGSSDLSKYVKDYSFVISEDCVKYIDVYGSDRFAISFTNKAGTSPTCNAIIRGVN